MMTDAKSAREMVCFLLKEGDMKPESLSEALEGRVSSRTIYRWARGESMPQNPHDVTALQKIYEKHST